MKMYVLGIAVLLLPLGLFMLFPGSAIGSSAVAIVLGTVASQKAWKLWREKLAQK